MAGKQRPSLDRVEVVEQSTAPAPKARKVKVGDIVLYAQRSNSVMHQDKDVIIYLPLLVTNVQNDEATVDGMVFSTGSTSFIGGHTFYDVAPGDELSTWKWKD